ncbi:hypothetical protein Amsp01_098570 [Amycolatopsis sp. NBRC 101858]|nr:hypothetical protein [Amycolatopsis sp. NBRC 101858]GLY43834.1 hypothetical protein Amsp01_098570 [Amycolatopsis sp. NBRC 101858]
MNTHRPVRQAPGREIAASFPEAAPTGRARVHHTGTTRKTAEAKA